MSFASINQQPLSLLREKRTPISFQGIASTAVLDVVGSMEWGLRLLRNPGKVNHFPGYGDSFGDVPMTYTDPLKQKMFKIFFFF